LLLDKVRLVTTRKTHRCVECRKLIVVGTKCLSRTTHHYIEECDYFGKTIIWYCSQDCYNEREMRDVLKSEGGE